MTKQTYSSTCLTRSHIITLLIWTFQKSAFHPVLHSLSCHALWFIWEAPSHFRLILLLTLWTQPLIVSLLTSLSFFMWFRWWVWKIYYYPLFVRMLQFIIRWSNLEQEKLVLILTCLLLFLVACCPSIQELFGRFWREAVELQCIQYTQSTEVYSTSASRCVRPET